MGREIPHDARVLLMEAEVDAAHRDEVDLAELTGLQQIANAVHRRAVEEGMPWHENAAGLLRFARQVERIVRRAGEGLLDEHMLSGRQRRAGDGVVGRDRRRDGHCLDRVVGEDLVQVGGENEARVARADLCQRALPSVADRDELRELLFVQVADQIGPPIAKSDDGRTDRVVRHGLGCQRSGPEHLDGHQAVPLCPTICSGVRHRSRRSRPRDQPRA